jgi:ABC-2 type transport system ATP-binding protein
MSSTSGAAAIGGAAISTDNLRVRRGHKEVLHGLSLQVPRGALVGLLGPSGSGKSTLMRCLVGVQRVASGTATVLGSPAGSALLRDRIGYVTQAASVYDDLTVRQNLNYFRAVLGAPKSDVDRVIDEVDLRAHAGSLVGSLSGGERGRASLAAALLGSPDLLVLDEPTVGLDPIARSGVWERVRQMRADYGMTVLLTTHYMDEADELCDVVALMHRGRLQVVGSPAALRADTGPDATLDDVFRRYAGTKLVATEEQGGVRDVRRSRTTARKLG